MADDQAWPLFDLNTDLGETRNLADRHPVEVRRLADRFSPWDQEVRKW